MTIFCFCELSFYAFVREGKPLNRKTPDPIIQTINFTKYKTIFNANNKLVELRSCKTVFCNGQCAVL